MIFLGYIYMYIYIYKEREIEREYRGVFMCVGVRKLQEKVSSCRKR